LRFVVSGDHLPTAPAATAARAGEAATHEPQTEVPEMNAKLGARILTTLVVGVALLGAPAQADLPDASADCKGIGLGLVGTSGDGLPIVDGPTLKDPSTQSDTQFDSCLQVTNCNEAGGWYVTGEYQSGDGGVHFWVDCGGTEIAHCTATDPGVPCTSDVGTSLDGDLGCWAAIFWGNPSGISGQCIDPINPLRVLRAELAPVELIPGGL
jgi:hypothetical protein